MAEWADSNGLRVVGYVVVAVLALVAARRDEPDDPSTWRPFWYLTGAMFVAMAIGRAGGIAELIGDTFRDEAISDGWYASRRPLQAAVVGSVGAAWFVSVLLACWRIPERRRRYLPMIVIVTTIVAFAAIRMVSLHQVDSLLYRTHIAGVRVGTLTECALLAVAAACTFWAPAVRRQTLSAA